MSTNNDLERLIPLAEAAKRLPSRKPGKRLNIATLYRWVLSGKLPAVKIGSAYFVDERNLVKLIEPVTVTESPAKQSHAWRRDQEEAERRVREWVKPKRTG